MTAEEHHVFKRLRSDLKEAAELLEGPISDVLTHDQRNETGLHHTLARIQATISRAEKVEV